MTVSPVRVLCVDDEPGLADVVAFSLERADDGIRAMATSCPEDALERLACDDAECVVSDYEMPVYDGAWLSRQVSDRWEDVPFILYTARRPRDVLDDAGASLTGVSAIVQKGTGRDHYATLARRIRAAVDDVSE